MYYIHFEDIEYSICSVLDIYLYTFTYSTFFQLYILT